MSVRAWRKGQASGNPIVLRRPDRGAKQGEPGIVREASVGWCRASGSRGGRPHLVGLPIYKMTGRGTTSSWWGAYFHAGRLTPADVQAACARGTGVGADGLVFVTPDPTQARSA